jgi:uncharacterized protein with von Willebrand factor type A (vWA) domain
MSSASEQERLRRWRLVLGVQSQSTRRDNPAELGLPVSLAGDDDQMDKVLEALYDSERSAGLGSSSPNVNRWLGDIRTYFPKSVVQVMQKDALERLHLNQMLLEPETLETVEADVQLIGTLLSLNRVIPKKTRETARKVVRKVINDLERRLKNPMIEAVRGALTRATRTSRPKAGEIDWDRTIRKNMRHYLRDRRTIVAEHLVGFGRRRSALRDVVLCIDQSGSMAASIVYASIFGAVLASLRAINTRLVVFDTSVVDLTDRLHDPVDVLFGTQLGGGTDINQAVTYCRQHITRPSQTIFVLISDLYEGGVAEGLLRQTAELVKSGVVMVCLLALSDRGSPCYDERLAAQMTALGAPSFACTPDLFPELMATAICKRDIAAWAARREIVTR